MNKKTQKILDFWFKESLLEELFGQEYSFDEKIRNRFFNNYKAAIAGEYDHW